MRAPLPNNHAHYGFPANRAGLPRALVNAEIILEIAAAVYPIDARPLALNAIQQHRPHAFPQPGSLGFIQAVCRLQWVQPCQVQRFIGVDVAHSSNEGLVQQQRFELAAGMLQALGQRLSGEARVERLGSQLAQDAIRVGYQPVAIVFR